MKRIEPGQLLLSMCAAATAVKGMCRWIKAKCQLDATRQFYWCIFSSTCFGYIRPSSGALDAELQHVVFCTEFLEGWWSWEPLLRSCVRCGWCRTAPSAPYTVRPDPARKLSANLYDIYHCCVYSEKSTDGGQRNCPKHVEFCSKN